MTLFVVDIESDGPCPGLYSMVSFGAVCVSDTSKTFYGKVRPISEFYRQETLDFLGITREEHCTYDDPFWVMHDFEVWVNNVSDLRPVFVSDNPAFDWQFINYYFHKYTGSNIFGFSARRIGDFWAGLNKDWNTPGNSWKKYRTTKHTHNPVDDAMGNVEALLTICSQNGIKIA